MSKMCDKIMILTANHYELKGVFKPFSLPFADTKRRDWVGELIAYEIETVLPFVLNSQPRIKSRIK